MNLRVRKVTWPSDMLAVLMEIIVLVETALAGNRRTVVVKLRCGLISPSLCLRQQWHLCTAVT